MADSGKLVGSGTKFLKRKHKAEDQMTSKVEKMKERCGAAWDASRSTVERFRDDERGGIEKVVAIAIVVLITTSALAAITIVVQGYVDDIPDADGGGEFTVD